MDGFSYYNIFETKGIEYIVILIFLGLLIPFWLVLNRKIQIKKRVDRMIGILSPRNLRIPQGLFFCRNHTWTFLERSGEAKVGLDDLLVHITGSVNIMLRRESGTIIRKGELLAELEHEGRHLQILSPISGTITRGNPLLEEDPGIVREDPFRQGWVFEIRPSDWMRETRSCYVAGEASGWMDREFLRFKDFIVNSMNRNEVDRPGIILQDGGEIRDQTLAELPETLWKEFQDEFLNSTD
jgi:glycine cleavage system H protein